MTRTSKSRLSTIFYGLALTLLALSASLNSAQAATVTYTLEDITLENSGLVHGEQITGTFEWTWDDPEDFEGGSAVFSELLIPWTTFYNFEDGNLAINIEANGIEISGNGDWHDYGLDIKLAFQSPFTATQAALLDTSTSSFDCCGNGFHKGVFVSGSVSPTVVPLPASAWLLGSGLLGLMGVARRRKPAH